MTAAAVLTVLGIFVGVPAVIGFALAGLYIARARTHRAGAARVAARQLVHA